MLTRLAQGATSRRKALRARINHAGPRDPDHEFVAQLHRARQTELQAHRLACDVRTLVHWLRHDVLALEPRGGTALDGAAGLVDWAEIQRVQASRALITSVASNTDRAQLRGRSYPCGTSDVWHSDNVLAEG